MPDNKTDPHRAQNATATADDVCLLCFFLGFLLGGDVMIIIWAMS